MAYNKFIREKIEEASKILDETGLEYEIEIMGATTAHPAFEGDHDEMLNKFMEDLKEKLNEPCNKPNRH